MTSTLSPRRFWTWLVLAMLLFACGLAIGPRLGPEQVKNWTTDNCLYRIDLPGPFGILLNCDSPTMIANGAYPGQLREPKAYFQDRPGMAWLAWAMAKPLSLLTDAVTGRAADQVGLPEGGTTHSHAQALRAGAPVYLAYLLIHAALLVGTVVLIRSTARACGLNPDVAGLAAAPLLLNDMTKAFLLSPHQQMFNIFLPVALAAFLFSWLRRGQVPPARVLALGLAGGLGLLCYQGWLTVPFVLLVGLAWGWWQGGASRANALQAAWRWPVTMALLFVPYGLWYWHVQQRIGGFNVPLVSEGKVGSWVMEGLRHAPLSLPGQVAAKVGGLVRLAAAHAWPFVGFGLVALAVWRLSGVRLDEPVRRQLRQACAAAAVTSAVFIFVFMMSSWTIWRYGFTMLPAWGLPIALLCAACWQALPTARARGRLVAGLALLTVVTGVVAVAKHGPWC